MTFVNRKNIYFAEKEGIVMLVHTLRTCPPMVERSRKTAILKRRTVRYSCITRNLMIAHIRGTIINKDHQQLTVDVQGIGYAIAVADDRLYKKDQQISLQVHTHWSQENGPQLFGFDSSAGKAVFQHIVSCSGCGPKIGLAVLSAMQPYHFLQVVATGDAKALSQVHGIGPKKAELIIMQLKDKVAKMAPEEFHPAQHAGLHKIKQISAALSALHYKQSEVAQALDVITKQTDIETRSFDELLKQALSVLAKKL